MPGVLIRRGRHSQRKDDHVEMEAEIGDMLSYTKNGRDYWQPPEAGRGKEGFSPRAFRGSIALLTPLFWNSSFQNCERVNFCCLKPPSL